MLNQTINVKIRYENIIKKMLENDHIKSFVLQAIEGSLPQGKNGGTGEQLEVINAAQKSQEEQSQKHFEHTLGIGEKENDPNLNQNF